MCTATAPFIDVSNPAGDGAALLAVDEGQCVFYDRVARRCTVQSALGHDALPLACRQFPRVSLRDPRGVSVTLSHYCPTACSLLTTEIVPAIVVNATAFPQDGEYVGLDAVHALPPLLRPDMLMDWESWWKWEHLSVALIAAAELPAIALSRLAIAVEHARCWSPKDGPLVQRVAEAFDRAQQSNVSAFAVSAAERDRRREEVIDAIPPELRPTMRQPQIDAEPSVAALTRFIAAHAFANWTAHLGHGLRTWLQSIEAPMVLIQAGMDVRTVDLWLRHLVDPQRMAEVWTKTE